MPRLRCSSSSWACSHCSSSSPAARRAAPAFCVKLAELLGLIAVVELRIGQGRVGRAFSLRQLAQALLEFCTCWRSGAVRARCSARSRRPSRRFDDATGAGAAICSAPACR